MPEGTVQVMTNPPGQQVAGQVGNVSNSSLVCPKCGISVADTGPNQKAFDYPKCPQCGVNMTNNAQTASDKNVAGQAPANTDAQNVVNSSYEENSCGYCKALNESEASNCYRCGKSLISEDFSDFFPVSDLSEGEDNSSTNIFEYVCSLCGSQELVCNEDVSEIFCVECGHKTVSEGALQEGAEASLRDLQDAVIYTTLAMGLDESEIGDLATYIIWGQFNEGTIFTESEELAGTPPKWIPEYLHESWKDIISSNGIETQNDAMKVLKNTLRS